jgi:hypothetical protein
MRVVLLIVVLAAHVCGLAAGAFAQSLGEVAKKEEARRKAVKAPSKVYTNDSLGPVEPAPPAPAAPPAAPAASAEPAPSAPDAAASAAPAPAAAAPAAAPRDEKYWRGRMEATRTALARAETLQDALQSRINVLSADFVNRDDPAQRNVIAADRQKALAELERVKKEIADGQKMIAAIQEDARRANVPAGWVR